MNSSFLNAPTMMIEEVLTSGTMAYLMNRFAHHIDESLFLWSILSDYIW